MSLLEITIAFGVLSFAAFATLGSMETTLHLDKSNSERAIALRAAVGVIERVRAYDYGADFQDFIDHWSNPANSGFDIDGLEAPEPESIYGGTTAGSQTGTQGYTQGGTTSYGTTTSRRGGSIAIDTSDPLRTRVNVEVSWKGQKGNERIVLPMTFTGINP